MRRAFLQRISVTPAQYRDRFSARELASAKPSASLQPVG
jgi:hypothetical protein